MKPTDIRIKCKRLKIHARKFFAVGMSASYRRTVNEHNALAHSYNRNHKDQIELI